MIIKEKQWFFFLHLLLFCIILSQADFKWRYFTIGDEEGILFGGSGRVTVKAGYINTIPQSSFACSASPQCFVEEIFSLEIIEVCVLIVSPMVHGKSLPPMVRGKELKSKRPRVLTSLRCICGSCTQIDGVAHLQIPWHQDHHPEVSCFPTFPLSFGSFGRESKMVVPSTSTHLVYRRWR